MPSGGGQPISLLRSTSYRGTVAKKGGLQAAKQQRPGCGNAPLGRCLGVARTIFGAPRTKRRWISLAGPLVALAAALVFVLAASASISTDAGFEGDDANLVSNGATDWNSFSPAWSGTKPYRTGTDTSTVANWTFTGVEDAQKPPDKSDTQFGGGVKQDDDCAKLSSTSNPPNKDDLKRIYIANATVGGHVYLALGWARIPQNTTSSSMHVAFEFNQADPSTDGCGSGSSLVKRSSSNGGDMLVVYDFEGGSVPVTLKLLRWKTSGTCEQTSKAATSAGCWVNTANFNAWQAKVNTTDSSDAIAPDGTDTLHTQEFGEAIVDLTTAGVFPASPTACLSFGRAFGVSRSSGNSGTAAMEDLAGPADLNITNCGTVIVKKVTKDTSGTVTTSDTTQFGYSTTVQTLPGPNSVADFHLTGQPSGTPSDTKTIRDAQAGTGLTVTESDPGSSYALDTIVCTGGSNRSTNPTTRVATFDLGAGQTVTCTYTNKKLKVQSSVTTSPYVYPNDDATVTAGTGLANITGSVTFKLYSGASAATNCAADNGTAVVYSETVNLTGTNTSKTVGTSNPGTTGTPNSYKISASTANNLYWRVTYSGDSNQFGRYSCAEYVGVTLNGDSSGGTNVP